MATLESLTVKLLGDATSLVKASEQGSRSIKKLAGGVRGALAGFGGLAAAVTGVAGTVGLVRLGNAARSNVDDLAKLASKMGTTTTEAQELKLVAQLSGLGIEDMRKSLQRLTRLQGDAVRGNKQAIGAFDALGISLKQLESATPIQLFRATVDSLGRIDNAAERASKGNALFAETWQQLNPLIEGAPAAFGQAERVFRTMSLGLGESAAQVEKLNDSLTVLGEIFTALRDKFFTGLAPVLLEAVESITRLVEAAGGLGVVVGGIGAALDAIIAPVRAVGGALGKIGAFWSQVFEGNVRGALSLIEVPGSESNAGEQLNEMERQSAILERIERQLLPAGFG